ncbi:hypothetical protein ScPMuIL_018593 [Solemya velum]
MIRLSIPGHRKVEDNHEHYTAFQIEVWVSGKTHRIEKRYSEFEELHKQLKKIIPTPEFPPKKVLKWNSRVIENRRQGLQVYLQGVLQGEIVPKGPLFKFLGVSFSSSGSFESLTEFHHNQTVTHQAMIGFPKDAFLQDSYRSSLPDIVADGVNLGLYSPYDESMLR